MLASLFWRLGAFFLGLLLSGIYQLPIAVWWSGGFWLASRLLKRYIYWRQFFLLLACLSLGMWRVQTIAPANEHLQLYFGQTAEWEFQICADPEPAWDKQVVVLCPLSSILSKAANEKVTANLPLYPRVYYGDYLQLKCRLEAPPVFADFNYAAYLAAKGIGAICSWPTVLRVEPSRGNKIWWQRLFIVKYRARQTLNLALPEPAAGLATALLLGYKKTLFPAEEKKLQIAGLSHLVAISGGHIGLFLELLISLFIYGGLNRKHAIWPALMLVVLYVALTGFQASAWRSLLMGGIALYAWRRGRLANAWLPLAWAAALMLWQNPLLWQRDLGFQLSFLALAGMIALNPILSAGLERCSSRFRYNHLRPVAQAFNLSLAAQLAVWPLLALKMGGVSLIAPFTNVLAFAVFAPLILFLLLALIITAIWPGVPLILWSPSYILLEYLLRLGRMSANWSWSYLETPDFTSIQAAGYYFGLILLVLAYWRLTKKPREGLFRITK